MDNSCQSFKATYCIYIVGSEKLPITLHHQIQSLHCVFRWNVLQNYQEETSQTSRKCSSSCNSISTFIRQYIDMVDFSTQCIN